MRDFFTDLKENEYEIVEFSKEKDCLAYFKERKTLGLIIEGEAKVYYKSLDNKTLFLNVLKTGGIVGLTSLEDNKVDTVIYPKTILKVKVLKETCLNELLNNLDFNRAYLKMLNTKINFLLEKIRLLTTTDVKVKIISFLLANANENIILLNDSKQELINYLNISKASLFNELNKLKKQDLITYKNKKIEILDKEKLINYLEELR